MDLVDSELQLAEKLFLSKLGSFHTPDACAAYAVSAARAFYSAYEKRNDPVTPKPDAKAQSVKSRSSADLVSLMGIQRTYNT